MSEKLGSGRNERQKIFEELEALEATPNAVPQKTDPTQKIDTPASPAAVMRDSATAAKKADLADAIAAAKGADSTDTPPDMPESEYLSALGAAQDSIAKGTPLDAAIGHFIKKLGARPDAEKEIRAQTRAVNTLIRQLQDAVNAPGVRDEERAALLSAIEHPSATVQAPDTVATKKALDILKNINDEIKGIQAPPSLRKYGKTMLLRPAGEVSGSLLEGGLATLIVTSAIKTALGVTIAPHSAAHLVTYGVSAVGLNMGMNMTTKSGLLQSVANRGSITKGFGDWYLRDKKGNRSTTNIATKSVRLASIGLLLAGGVAVAQKVLSNNDSSDRNSTLIAEPIRNQKEKIKDFEARLRAFGPVIPKILEIASRVESGRPPNQQQQPVAPAQVKGPKGQAQAPRPAPATKWGNYSADEIAKMKRDELEPLFIAAGLDLQLLSNLNFNQPADTGEGPIFEFKRALRTGDMTKLRDLKPEDLVKLRQKFGAPAEASTSDMVTKIRTEMGLKAGQTFEQKTAQLIDEFLKSKELAEVEANLDEALRIGGVIRSQGESVIRTFRSAFLEGTPPLGIDAVLPYVNPIAEQKDKLIARAKIDISDKLTASLSKLSEALGELGGSVDTPKLPDWSLDVTPSQQLAETIRTITAQATGNALAEKEAQSSFKGMLDGFIPGLPGSDKARGSERYVAKTLLSLWGGYKVVTQGEKTFIYEKTGNAETKRGYSAAGADAWNQYLFGRDSRQNAEKTFPADLNLQKATSLSDADLGEAMIEHVKSLAALAAQNAAAQPNNAELARMAAQFERMSALPKNDLGKLVRAQIGTQFGVQRVPILYTTDVWAKILAGEIPPQLAQDAAKWSEIVMKADPSFSEQFVAHLSALGDKELGTAVSAHIGKIIDHLEKNQGDQYMLRQYRAMTAGSAADSKKMELGALARKQLAYQIEHRMNPPVVYPASVWAAILDPSLSDSSNENIDPSVWKQLPQEQADKLFQSYVTNARTEAFAVLSSTVLLLSLGTFAASLTAVRNRNKNLLRAKDKFAARWHEVEAEVQDKLDGFNAALKQMPFFASLPPMEPYMLLAAFRKLGEEYQTDLREDLTFFQTIKAELKGALAKGPYAETIVEIFAMEKLFNRLQTDPKAMRKLQDIIAPGLGEVAEITANMAVNDPKKTPMENLLTTMQALDQSGKELMRDAARGHLRFRQEVAKARMTLNERGQADIAKSDALKSIMDTTRGDIPLEQLRGDDLKAEQLVTLQRLSEITSESVRFDEMENTYDVMLDQLDTEALAEEMLSRYRPPRTLTRRAQRADRASDLATIEVPKAGVPLKEFSLVAALANDEKSIVEAADKTGTRFKEACMMLLDGTIATRKRFADQHPGRTLDMHISVTAAGDVSLQVVEKEGQDEVSRINISPSILGQALYQPFAAAQKLNGALETL